MIISCCLIYWTYKSGYIDFIDDVSILLYCDNDMIISCCLIYWTHKSGYTNVTDDVSILLYCDNST